MSLREAADLIGGVRPEWLRQQLASGKIADHQIGRRWRMTTADLDAALEIWSSKPRTTADETALKLTKTSGRRIES